MCTVSHMHINAPHTKTKPWMLFVQIIHYNRKSALRRLVWRYLIVRHEIEISSCKYYTGIMYMKKKKYTCVCVCKECSMWDYDTSKTKEFNSHTRQSNIGWRGNSHWSLLFILISISSSIGWRQIGHLLDWSLSSLAQSLHMHCRQRNTRKEIKYKRD